MTHKMRKTLIMIVMAALIICLMAASLTYTFTYGLYTGGKFDSEKSPYDDLIEFVGAREYTVRSPEELIQAIEDGYSNIVISEDAEQPFVITEGVTDVTANLVLNLNGNVVVRNSRNPMLDVQTNVSVVLVYDSKNTGAFYNPVGSSLMASGGSLTVGSGGYESGPRAEEFQGNASAGTLGSAANATLFARSNGENAVTSPVDLDRSQYISGYSPVAGVSLPTITPKTTQENNRETVRGNVYLNSTHSDWLPADTFLVYTIEEDCFIGDGTSSGGVTFEEDKLYVDAEKETVGNDTIITASEFTTPLCDVASCDFYYYYPIGDDDNDGYEDYAVIYGYWDVMKLASNDGSTAENLREKGLVYPYGAVRMVEGEGIVRGGTFYNHFDVANTYGIYAEGGRLSVSRNTTFETTFSSGGEGVCIRSSGESAELTISGGDFSSEVGNTIEMLNGNMTVTKGSFIKTGCKEGTGDKQLENQTAIISLLGGTLNVSGAKTGDVTMTAGAENSTLENVFGIRADGGGTVTTKGVSFQIYGDYSAGVLSYDGTIDLGDNTAITVEQSDQYENGNNTLLTSAGVSSEQASGNEENPVNLSGNVTIDSNGLGITARGVVNVTGGKSIVKTTRGTGIYVNNGQFNVKKDATISVESTVKSGFSWATPPESSEVNAPNIYNGVYVQGGSIASEGTLNVTHTGEASDGNAAKHYSSYAVSVEGGNVTLGSGAIAGNSAGGIYVSGGELTAGAVTVSAGGTVSDDTFTANDPTYAAGVLVKKGTVRLSGAKIYSTALGVAVLGGNFTTEGTSSVTATRATGIYVQGGTVTNSGELEVTSDLFDDSDALYTSAGADFGGSSTAGGNIYNGIFVNGGSLVSEGVSSILNVTFKGAAGDTPSSASSATKSYAVYVTNSSDDGATETTNTYASIRQGALNAAQAGGVYVHGGDVVLGAQYDENDNVVGNGTVAIKTGSLNGNAIDTSAGTYGAGVFADNGKAVLYGEVNVDCAAIGIVATAADTGTGTGAVTIESGTTTITAYRSTGVYIRGGSLENSGTLSVKSTITNSTGGTASTAEDAYKWAGADISGDTNSNIYNGVFVNGGSLNSTGTLNVTFTGVQNDAFGDGDNSGLKAETAYYLFKTKSYAVRVEGSGDTTVRIASGNITNAVGGGVLVNGGKVTLGREGEGAYMADENGNSSGLTVETTGYGLEDTNRVLVNNESFDSWIYRCTTTGGDAVKIDGGTLKILGGQYQTAHGNGIFVRGAQAAEEDAYAVEISGGAFRGYNSSEYGENADLTGPAQSYGIKIIGGKVLVNGGTFGSSNVTRTNGSAFFMGLPDEEAEIKIQRGNFYSKNTDAVATFRYTDIIFEDLSDNNQNINISVIADRDRAAVALQDDQLFSQGDRSSTVTINGGTYTANGFGVWYGCSQDNLNIQKGIFTGRNISGLYFNVHPTSNGVDHVTLSGGTYYGPKNDVYARGYVVYFDYENRTTNNAIQGNNMNLLYQNLLLDSSQYYAYGDVEAARSKFDLGSDVSYSISREYGEMQYTNDKGLARLRYGISYDQEMVYSKITINHR